MTNIRDWIDDYAEENEEQEILVMGGYDHCIVGVLRHANGQVVVVYDRLSVLRELMRQGMTEEEALEFHWYNQAGAWCGKGTPLFLDRPSEDDDVNWGSVALEALLKRLNIK